MYIGSVESFSSIVFGILFPRTSRFFARMRPFVSSALTTLQSTAEKGLSSVSVMLRTIGGGVLLRLFNLCIEAWRGLRSPRWPVTGIQGWCPMGVYR
jgi:hypothetical protein